MKRIKMFLAAAVVVVAAAGAYASTKVNVGEYYYLKAGSYEEILENQPACPTPGTGCFYTPLGESPYPVYRINSAGQFYSVKP